MQTANGLAASYAPGAYRRDAIPVQEPLKNISRFAKSLEARDFIERLAWGDYAGLDISISPNSVIIHQSRMREISNKSVAGPAWNHKQQPTEFIKTRWQLLLMFAGAFADYSMLKFWMLCAAGTGVIMIIVDGNLESLTTTFFMALGLCFVHLFSATPSPGFCNAILDSLLRIWAVAFFARRAW